MHVRLEPRIHYRRVTTTCDTGNEGYRQILQLATALEAATADQPDTLDVRVKAS